MSTDSPQQAPAPEASMCYRHPDRETYVRCTRCDRPICPDCMRVASVGHQCPECVREGNRTARQARTVFGGRVRARPVVTLTLIGLNVLAYIGELVSRPFVNRFEMVGGMTAHGGVPGFGVVDGEWYRLITAAFLHMPMNQGSFGITHILFNMWALWVLGPQLEQVLGQLRFTVLYVLSAIGGNVLLYLVDPLQPAVGASGAIFGLFAAFFVVGRRLGIDTRGIVFLIVINLMFTFTFSGKISWEGHVGGLVTGAVLAVAFAYAPRQRQKVVQVAASAVVAALLVVLTVVQTAALTS